MSVSPERIMLAIADAAEDARASKMLAADISNAFIEAHKDKKSPHDYVKEAMGKWYRSYGEGRVPVTEFLIGKVTINADAGLYYCQPPSTLIYDAPYAIGRGSHPVEPLLSLLSNNKCPLRPALLSMAYLLYVAKKDEGSACGGDSGVLIITKDGGWTFLEHEEMMEAEKLAGELYRSTNSLIAEVVGMPPIFKGDKRLPERLKELSEKMAALDFPSLKYLETNKFWKEKPRLASGPQNLT